MFDLNICMQDFKITCPEDWYAIQRTTIASWKKNHPMFVKDIQRLEKTVQQHISEASSLLVKYRQTHSRTYLELVQQQYAVASEIIKTFSKRELLATLSQR